MRTTTIELDTPEGVMPVYEAVPTTARGAVIVIQEAFGVNEHIQDVTRRFADEGYWALAPHIFHRAGGGTAPYDDFSKVLPFFEGLTDDAILDDIDACVEFLRVAGIEPGSTGAVGFCFGGRVSFLLAARRSLGAAVGFYGGGIVNARRPQFPPLVSEAPGLMTPWLGLFGDQDHGIPVEEVETLRVAVESAAVATEVVRYADAGHGFHCDARESYDDASARDGWRRTLAWLETHLAPL